jgi:hypothetical protein
VGWVGVGPIWRWKGVLCVGPAVNDKGTLTSGPILKRIKNFDFFLKQNETCFDQKVVFQSSKNLE